MKEVGRRHRLGMLTPSSNTVLEPVIGAMLADLPEVSAHFTRFRVTEILLGQGALGQFELEPMLAAADLLADARVASICWNGPRRAGWASRAIDGFAPRSASGPALPPAHRYWR
jgi:maleate isomerase